MAYFVTIVLMLLLSGCATAYRSEDGNTMKFFGTGSAEFSQGGKIESKTPLPELPPIRMDLDEIGG